MGRDPLGRLRRHERHGQRQRRMYEPHGWSAGLLVCGATAVTDNAFYANVWGGSSWSGWSKIGGSATGSPACAPLG